MKIIFNLLLLSIAFNWSTTIAKAQNGQSCFMVDVHGNPLDLSYLCQNQSLPSNYIRSAEPVSKTVSELGVYTIPIMRRISGIPVIEVNFNDRYTFEMMLDTGASVTTLTRQMAKTLKIKPEGSIQMQSASDTIYVPWSWVNSVKTGGIKSKQVAILISPSMDMGLLGQNFFGIYDVTIKEKVVEFRER